MQDDVLGPLVGAMKKLEEDLQKTLDSAAILRKRIEVVRSAIDVLRSTDAEVMEIKKKPKYVDPTLVEVEVEKALASGPIPLREIKEALASQGIAHTEHGIRVVLRKIAVKVGERNYTRYTLNRG